MPDLDPQAIAQRTSFLADLTRWGPREGWKSAIKQPLPSCSVKEALDYCRHLAHSHYENFSIASRLIPRKLRPHFFNIYAYCRWSDDLADEADVADRSFLLAWWRGELVACLDRNAPESKLTHPVLIALRQTLQEFPIDTKHFHRLLDAFEQDQQKFRYESDEELEAYCQGSAQPVGRIVLALAGVTDPQSIAWSDSICTGLQLANFCQDMRRDANNGRIYLPRQRWISHGLEEAEILAGECTLLLQSAVRDWVADIRPMFETAEPLAKAVPAWLARDIRLFAGGGLAILDSIEESDFDVWSQRIEVTRFKMLALLTQSMLPPMDRWLRSEKASLPGKTNERARDIAVNDLSASYAACQQVAVESKSSFYRSFSLLRPAKRKGMMALYAFARKLDDISDGARSDGAKRSDLQAWRHRLQRWNQGSTKNPLDPIEPALFDTIQRFQIPIERMLELMEGVELDLDEEVRFEDAESLRSYCYRVAGTIGLACLSIWGGPRCAETESKAIECGMAFQWTNMLRDIREDSLRGRIYFPANELTAFSITQASWLEGKPTGDWNGFLDLQIQRARQGYAESRSLIESLELDGQKMFGLMWSSYRTLLEEIDHHRSQLFEQRISIPSSRKWLLAAQHFISPWFLRAKHY